MKEKEKRKDKDIVILVSVWSEVATNCLVEEADSLFLETTIVHVPKWAFSFPRRHQKTFHSFMSALLSWQLG